ncbi:hypothetical protein BDE02_15G012200 [Populus trichocarpa]|nr:hypothetical protein BDE02_15G012200 [Populus trichocarpa]
MNTSMEYENQDKNLLGPLLSYNLFLQGQTQNRELCSCP